MCVLVHIIYYSLPVSMGVYIYIYIYECIEYHIYVHVILLGRAYEHIVLVHYREISEVSL